MLHTVIICFFYIYDNWTSVTTDTLLLALFNIKNVAYILCLAMFCVIVVETLYTVTRDDGVNILFADTLFV